MLDKKNFFWSKTVYRHGVGNSDDLANSDGFLRIFIVRTCCIPLYVPKINRSITPISMKVKLSEKKKTQNLIDKTEIVRDKNQPTVPVFDGIS